VILLSQKKTPCHTTEGFFYTPATVSVAGYLGQPSLQWETGRILNLEVHIAKVSFRVSYLIPNKILFILILFFNMSSGKISKFFDYFVSKVIFERLADGDITIQAARNAYARNEAE
jgi:hypothetical protein